MNQHEIPSSSPDVTKIKEAHKSALDIADHVIQESSLVEHFQNKVNEVQIAREQIITLQSQLKISEEAQRLMEAEFSFQKEEYEKEIEKHKKYEEELQNELIKKCSQQTTINVEALIAKEKEKYETKTKELQSQIEQLQTSLNEANSKSKSTSENQIDFSEISNVSASLQAKIDESNQKIKQLQAEIQSKDQIIRSQATQLKEKENSLSELKSQINTTNESVPVVIEKLRNRLNRAKDKITEMQKIEVQNKKFAEILTHYETQREILNDILQTNDENPKQDWTNLQKAAVNAMAMSRELPKVKSQLESAQQQVDSLKQSMKDYNSLKDDFNAAKSRLIELNNINDKYNKLQIDYNMLKSSANRNEQFSSMMSIRNRCALALNMSQREITNAVSKLHTSITGKTENNLRPIALSLFFITRWRRIAQHRTPETEIDPMALVAFSSSNGHSTLLKIDAICKSFIGLTNEVVSIKAKLARSQEKRQAMKQIIIDQQTASEQGYAKLKREKQVAVLLKERMKELQKEMSLLISSERAEELRTRITELEVENDKLTSENQEMDETINEQAAAIDKLSAQLVEAEASKNYSGKEVERLKQLASKREKEAEVLDARLKEKTRDMLALERYAVQTENNPFKRGAESSSTTIVTKVNGKFLPSQ
ncbi:hypothetical protein TVAG_151330 [Trichomonas vaginalis G3]|uniref:Uncharacterized protein n=1 Tax=Trichomonas vaginalis (strain ATCC PRA-98 / G3) TaxID=412133 RepID=A2EQD0_TRIV3|nr:hypothetical protein TVAGG3_0726680 [Trichomonas vaginalis G3]EAY05146.1 hypothetical protein TVAG_151330 [Trichomonas vaginalis G3]KAI5510959.1 hypothetical protein TVAGG3_0726680 [Trichomonas vaginalis G3]|eukprot:XP_001317369.1 hypothetical protein [Trichomonas vaginalis G3]